MWWHVLLMSAYITCCASSSHQRCRYERGGKMYIDYKLHDNNTSNHLKYNIRLKNLETNIDYNSTDCNIVENHLRCEWKKIFFDISILSNPQMVIIVKQSSPVRNYTYTNGLISCFQNPIIYTKMVKQEIFWSMSDLFNDYYRYSLSTARFEITNGDRVVNNLVTPECCKKWYSYYIHGFQADKNTCVHFYFKNYKRKKCWTKNILSTKLSPKLLTIVLPITVVILLALLVVLLALHLKMRKKKTVKTKKDVELIFPRFAHNYATIPEIESNSTCFYVSI